MRKGCFVVPWSCKVCGKRRINTKKIEFEHFYHRRYACRRIHSWIISCSSPKPELITPNFWSRDRKDETATNSLCFQDAILKLKDYWSAQGCVIWNPSNTEVGAGTMNPVTFLRVLGPEPWKVAYEEPSIRPDDSRYGDNPNRVQRHTQFQVILKPAPHNGQELFLGSLRALGIDVDSHDIRFVEDNWESPVLGAWGLGWEVWFDGLEITQFTYFQQAGGFSLDPVSLEITYGLERILIGLHHLSHFKDIPYTISLSYGDLLLQNEYEMSRFYLNEADISRHQLLFQVYEDECRSLIKEKLPLAAYDFVLKASHTFNILDARGAVGVTERAKIFQKIRSLACDVATLWLEKRKEQNFPLERRNSSEEKQSFLSSSVEESANGRQDIPSDSRLSAEAWEFSKTKKEEYEYFLFEIGTEELPMEAIHLAKVYCEKAFPDFLISNRISWKGDIHCGVTSRRIVIYISHLATFQSPQSRLVRGPPAKAAYNENGEPSKALLGFCQSQGISTSAVVLKEDGKSTYIFASIHEQGLPCVELLSYKLPEFLQSFEIPRSMRWNESSVAFPRPIRWLVAMLGDQIIPFQYAGITSANLSFGLRYHGKAIPFSVNHASKYLALLQQHRIMLSVQQRRNYIWEQACQIANALKGKLLECYCGTEGDEGLLQETSCLIESPQVCSGSFDTTFLKLPKEVLITVMKKHQRYFPLESVDNTSLLPHFIFVTHSNADVDQVRTGNEAVLKARYTDAEFFYQQDLSRTFEYFLRKLDGLIFQQHLGSMLAKNRRIERLVPFLSSQLHVADDETETLKAAAAICKADLASSMVIEFTSLAGTMGKYYALAKNYSTAVSNAIEEHYLPRFSGDIMPPSKIGAYLGVLDRIDSLVGLFAVGCVPKANSDPFALRRVALGLLQVLIVHEMNIDLRSLFEAAAQVQPVSVPSGALIEQVLDYATKRFENWLMEDVSTIEIANHESDIVRAVLSELATKPVKAIRVLKQVMNEKDTEDYQLAVQTYARPAKLLRSASSLSPLPPVDPSLFQNDHEKTLYSAIEQGYLMLNNSPHKSFTTVVQILLTWKPHIDAFFDHVFVMCPEEDIRKNRLALCSKIVNISHGIIDFTRLRHF
eukprot:jgi/Galph1/3506/GphlegSOOS_G2123.1